MNNPIIVKNLNFAYPEGRPIWQDANITLKAGQKVGIWGANGSGKTTLFNLIMGFLRPQSGQILLNGVLCEKESHFSGQRTTIGYAMQNPDDQIFCPTVFDEVAFALYNLGYSSSQVRTMVKDILNRFALPGYEHQIAYRLSGGEKRMISLAALWAMNPIAFLLDEPTLSLDPKWLAVFKDILSHSEQAWLMSSHDLDFLQATCQEIWQVEDGKLLCG